MIIGRGRLRGVVVEVVVEVVVVAVTNLCKKCNY
jgi:hypothetical protein